MPMLRISLTLLLSLGLLMFSACKSHDEAIGYTNGAWMNLALPEYQLDNHLEKIAFDTNPSLVYVRAFLDQRKANYPTKKEVDDYNALLLKELNKSYPEGLPSEVQEAYDRYKGYHKNWATRAQVIRTYDPNAKIQPAIKPELLVRGMSFPIGSYPSKQELTWELLVTFSGPEAKSHVAYFSQPVFANLWRFAARNAMAGRSYKMDFFKKGDYSEYEKKALKELRARTKNCTIASVKLRNAKVQ